jgi:hypothetical protein
MLSSSLTAVRIAHDSSGPSTWIAIAGIVAGASVAIAASIIAARSSSQDRKARSQDARSDRYFDRRVDFYLSALSMTADLTSFAHACSRQAEGRSLPTNFEARRQRAEDSAHGLNKVTLQLALFGTDAALKHW